jgi:deazaflavin-dependent oxidoreductase (nitroreductase family)
VPIPRFVRPFTKHVLNPITRRVAGRLPWFGIVTTVGRKSGRSFSTPVNVFHHEDEYVFALTYGPDVNWVQNALASGRIDIRHRGRTVRLGQPRMFDDPKGRAMPLPVRLLLRMMGIHGYLAMRPVEPADPDRRLKGSQ